MVPTAAISGSQHRVMPWPKTGASHYNALSGLPYKGLVINGLIV